MKPLRGAIVGLGYFSQFHLDAWTRMKDVELVGVCDLNSQLAEAMSRQWNVERSYVDFQSLLKQQRPDFVDIVTRPDSHATLSAMAAEHGTAIICQKPLAPTLLEAEEIVRCTKEAGVRFMVHENFRFQPWYRRIKSLLDAEAIGDKLHTLSVRTRTGDGWQHDAYMARQPYFRSMPRFLVHETGVHFIDTFRYLAGEIQGVYASLRRMNPAIAGEDSGLLLFEFASGAEGIWDANRYNESSVSDPRFTFGDVTVEANGGTIRLYQDGRLTMQPLGEKECDVAYESPYELVHQNFAADCVYHTQRHFVDCLRRNLPFETDGESYLKTLRVQEAVYTSAASRLPVRGLTSGNSHANHGSEFTN